MSCAVWNCLITSTFKFHTRSERTYLLWHEENKITCLSKDRKLVIWQFLHKQEGKNSTNLMTCGLYFQSCLIDEWLWRGAVYRELCWWASWSKAGRSSRLISLLPDDNFLALGGISSVRHTGFWVPSLLHFICLFFYLGFFFFLLLWVFLQYKTCEWVWVVVWNNECDVSLSLWFLQSVLYTQ